MIHKQWLSIAVVVLVFGLLVGLYLYNIDGWLKEDDEGTALYVTWRFAKGEMPYQHLVTTKGPLFLLIGAGLNLFLGPTILGLRVVTALAVVFGGFLWFRVLRSIYGLTAGLAGTVLLLLTPELYHLSRIFRADSWMLALIAGALGAFLVGLYPERRPWSLGLAGGLFGLAMLTKVLVFMPLAGCFLFLFIHSLASRRWKEGLWDIVLFAVPFLVVTGLGLGLLEATVPGMVRMVLGAHGGTVSRAPSWSFLIRRGIFLYVWFIAFNLVTILAIPFIRWVFPLRKRATVGLCFLCQLLPASVIFVIRGDVYPRYLAYTAFGFSGLFAMGISSILARTENRFRHVAIAVLILLMVGLGLFQVYGFLVRSEDGTAALVDYIVENTSPNDVILTDYGEIAFYAQRRSVPQTGGIGQGWAVAGLITGEELIQAIEDEQVSLVALHVLGGFEPPGHFYYLQDWDMFYLYIQNHFRFGTRIQRDGQLFEVYIRDVSD